MMEWQVTEVKEVMKNDWRGRMGVKEVIENNGRVRRGCEESE